MLYAQDSEKEKCDLDVSVQVLTTGNWPTYKKPELTLPAVMQPAVEQFERFFASDAEKRRLAWYFSLGSVKMKATFYGKGGEKDKKR